jgi:diguanylate cyclase (GGDEF)-like protein
MKRLRRDTKGLLRPKWGQVTLAGLLLACIMVLVDVSVTSLQAHTVERQQIMSEESDASAMIFVQRESFNTLISMRDWADGLQDAREVQIARALLGQRLEVITSSGKSTFNLTSPGYQLQLASVDKIIRGMTSVSDSAREVYLAKFNSTLSEFRSAVIALNGEFTRLSRAQILAVTDARAQSELVQAAVLVLILLLGLALSAWLAIDIITNYRKTSDDLTAQRDDLEVAERRLKLLHELEQQSASWLEMISSGAKTQEVLARIKLDLRETMPLLSLDFISNHDGEMLLVAGQEHTQPEDATLALSRVQEALQVMSTRDGHLRQLDHQRDYDQLTQLPNRAAFTRAVDAAVRVGAKSQRAVGLLLLDIDRFRDVNASLGYAVGDDLLMQVARRLSLLAQGHEQVARLSADEFGVLLSARNAREVEKRARLFAQELAFSTKLAGHQAQVSMSAGLAILGPQEQDRTDLSRWASMAIYLAKAPDDRGQFVLYSPDQHGAMLNTWYEELAVRNALRSGEFKVYYQPIMRLPERKAIGFEALVRWERPGHSVVYPNDFLPTVGRAGIAVELGWQIMENALAGWRDVISKHQTIVDEPPYVTVNVDAIQLADEGFAQFVIAAIQRNQMDAKHLVIEVTEGTLVNDGLALQQIRQLYEYGVKIALDDFGSGYNNLGQVHNLPLTGLKIDRSFLGENEISPKNEALITDILAIAKTLDLVVVVEGVETPAVEQRLIELGVPLVQGFLYSRAIPLEQVEGWLAENL